VTGTVVVKVVPGRVTVWVTVDGGALVVERIVTVVIDVVPGIEIVVGCVTVFVTVPTGTVVVTT